ncbi:MAG: SRPBCC family protein [Desulfobacterales bacterium]|jgi:hypothetical protein
MTSQTTKPECRLQSTRGGRHAFFRRFAAGILAAVSLVVTAAALPRTASESRQEAEPAIIEPIAPWQGVGKAYRMTYEVGVPVNVLWRFKTDFDGEFLTSNRYIESHRLVHQKPGRVVTENRYTYQPGLTFRWETLLFPSSRRMGYRLLNPKDCRQRFHFGTIQLIPRGDGTRVVQTAWFDFSGVWLWFHNPWGGGMTAFLRYNARWEQETALRLKDRYGDP